MKSAIIKIFELWFWVAIFAFVVWAAGGGLNTWMMVKWGM